MWPGHGEETRLVPGTPPAVESPPRPDHLRRRHVGQGTLGCWVDVARLWLEWGARGAATTVEPDASEAGVEIRPAPAELDAPATEVGSARGVGVGGPPGARGRPSCVAAAASASTQSATAAYG
jgi:hypothetical protein